MKHKRIPKTLSGRTGKDLLNLFKAKNQPLTKEDIVQVSNETEAIIFEFWAELLGHNNFGITDDFFLVGGSSIKAIQLISRISRHFKVQIELTELFEKSTIAAQSDFIENSVRSDVSFYFDEKQARPINIPLSFSQERLWFIDQLEGSIHYHLPFILKLSGKTDLYSLAKSFKELKQRHEILRTVYIEKDGEVFQHIKPKANGEFNIIDGTSLKNSEEQLEDFLRQLVNKPFDLTKDDMLRAEMVSLGSDENILVVTIHHIATDGWSTSVIITELALIYNAISGNQKVLLPAMAIQYADYAIWQRKYFTDEILKTKSDYWKQKLSGVKPIQLPLDFQRPVIQSNKGNVLEFELTKDCYGKLQHLSHQQHVTLFMTMFSAFNVLLSKYSGQSDICVGTPVAGRQHAETEDLIGFFVNTLAIRTEVNTESNFISFLEQVKLNTLKAFEHQDMPFEKVVEAVVKERDLSRSPLFQVMFVWLDNPELDHLPLGDVDSEQLEYNQNTTQFDITFRLSETVSGIRGAVEYCVDLFKETSIQRMIASFQSLLGHILENPNARLGELNLLSKDETHQLLTEFNATQTQYPEDKTILDLFAQQVNKSPNSTSVVYENQSLSFQELDEKSNQLANYLIELGVKPDSLVAICMERSLEMMVGILGILKANAAYVPIDPDYPQQRINYMLDDCKASIILSHSEVKISLPNKVVMLDTDWERINQQAKTKPATAPKPNHLAYVIYTSGSTGQPKGVMNQHSGLLNRLCWAQDYFKLTPKDKVLQKTTYSFDVSVWELLWPLISGAQLIFAIPGGHKDNVYLKEVIEKEQVTMLHFVPSMLEVFLSDLPKEACASLKKVLCSGEALKPSQVELFGQKLPQSKLFNLYGPTEAAIDVTCWEVEPNTETVPIGKPVANTQIYILNQQNQPVPIGVAGEIHIGGVQVARGYLNKAELTSEKFIPNPYSKTKTERLYKTGDLGKWTEDGTIEYLGRLDDQVKIRGYRIELGEIETAIEQLKEIKQSAVLAKDDAQGNKRLVAYVVARKAFDKSKVMTELQQKLPEYMVPQIWVELKELPLTPNGKTDRKALPEPDIEGQIQGQYVAPRNETEQKLAYIWQELLGVKRIGIHDNFFELGGHSLLATRLISSTRKNLHVELSIRDLFLAPSIAALSKEINALSESTLLPAIEKYPRPQFIPLSFAQERLWFLDRLEGSVQYHIPVVLKLIGKPNLQAIEDALKVIIDRHEILRTVILDEDGKGYQSIQSKTNWRLEIVDLQKWKDDPIALENEIRRIVNTPFHLSVDYMLRANLLKLTDEDYRLVITMHHIASDAWSLSILVNEFVELYQANNENRTWNLESQTLQYADYAMWQRKFLQGPIFDFKLNYWKEKLKDIEPLQIPTDFKRPTFADIKGESARFIISKSLTKSIYALGKRQGATPFMTLLTALKVLLYRYSNQSDICVGTSIATRPQQELEGLIGYFVNTLALRTQVNGTNSFPNLLNSVKQTVLDAYSNQDVPFEKIVDAVVSERDSSRTPLFQVMLVMNNTPQLTDIQLGEVCLTSLEFKSKVSKFDFTFFVSETFNGFDILVEYKSGLYKPETIEKLLEQYQILLQSIVANPEKEVGKLELFSKPDVDKLIHLNGFSKLVYPSHLTVANLFEVQANKTPNSIALVFEEKSLTYLELNEKANQLANFLIKKGVVQDDLIPFLADRDTNMIVGLLGILKSGAAYVPIDLDLPQDRIDFIIDDCKSKFLIDCRDSSDGLSYFSPAGEISTIHLVRDKNEISSQPKSNPKLDLGSESLAYVIYTSGSTGLPKGVMIEQRSLVDYIFGFNDKVNLSNIDSYALVSGITTDLGNTIVYGALLFGGALHLFTKEAVSDVEFMHAYFDKHRIDCLKIVPSHWKALSRPNQLLIPEKLLIFGGDVLQVELIENLRLANAKCKIINHYGPTETTIGKLLHIIEPERAYDRTIPIGKPFSNTKVFILNNELSLCPWGVVGQLYISGDGLARGYLNNPDLTSAKFIINPYSESEEKLYATGDLVKYLTDGNIEFVGRVDEQIKIRGYRIEPGEIESILKQYPKVSQAIVLARKDKLGNQRLLGYFTTNGEIVSKENLREFLNSRLPEYMVPQNLIELDAFPLTANGKIDKKALPEAEKLESDTNKYLAPENNTEIILADIWKELLDLESVGVHDNFFELGGDSIITIQLVSRARRAGLELQVGDVFTFQTIARLADLLEKRLITSSDLSEQAELEGVSGMLPIQHWFFEKQASNNSHFNQSVLLNINKEIPLTILKRAFEQLLTQHDALRFKYYQDEEGQWHQVYSIDNPDFLYSEILPTDSSDILESQINKIANFYQQSLNIEKGELLKVVLIQTPTSESANRLLIIVHHLAIDGVSWRILLEDFELLIRGILEGGNTDLGAKTASFRQWFSALESYSKTQYLTRQLPYWQSITNAYVKRQGANLNLSIIKVKDIVNYVSKLDLKYTSQLLHDVPKTYHTGINDILVAALAMTFKEFNNQDIVFIGMEGHGREDINPKTDTSRTIGWFTTHYPVMINMQEVSDEANAIVSVKEHLKQVPDKGIGYGVLKYLAKEKSLQQAIGHDVVFNYLGQSDNVIHENKWLSIADESSGDERSLDFQVNQRLTLNAIIINGELQLNWNYCQNYFNKTDIDGLTAKYLVYLKNLINHCIAVQKTGLVYTPSDYGLAPEVTYPELNQFLNETYHGEARKLSLESIYRLSGLQKGMLFYGLYDSGSDTYMRQFGCDLENVDVEKFKKSWNYLLQRHTTLKTAFYHDVFSIPIQVVYKHVKLPINILDFRHLNQVEQKLAIDDFIIQDKAQGFDFKMAPTMRLTLLQLDDKCYRMQWSWHHILFDGWSIPIIMEELLGTYELLVTGKPIDDLSDDRYEDYIHYIDRVDKIAEENYWRDYLKNLEQSTFLPFISQKVDRNKASGNYHAVSLELDEKLSSKVTDYAQSNRLTINTLMQGVWAVLLKTYTGNSKIVYGVTVSGRPEDLPGVESRVGMYINSLPLFTHVENHLGIKDWLLMLQAEQVKSRNYQYAPLHSVQSLTDIASDLFDTLLVFENYPISKVVSSGKWSVEIKNTEMQELASFPLFLSIYNTEKLKVNFNYNTSLIEESYLVSIRNHFENVLFQIIEKPNGILADLEVLLEPEFDQIVSKFNNTSKPVSKTETLVSLFEQQVSQTPLALALVFENDSLTYQALNEQSNQIAHYLRSKGIGHQMPVAVCLERSANLLVALLGILKAGAAYVPIDPEYPQQRIEYMLQDCSAKLLIKEQSSSMDLSIETLAPDSELLHSQPKVNLKEKPSPNDLVYIIYTSGSTGKPKGVMVEHHSLVNLISWHQDYYQVDAHSKSTSMAGVGFDAFGWEVWPYLTAGASIQLLNNEQRLSPEIIAELILDQGITHTYIPTALVPAVVDLTRNRPSSLKYLTTAGDQLLPINIQNLDYQLVNNYGPTEFTICATSYILTERDENALPLIGKPIANTRVYILSNENKICPIGVVGEILLGGAALARGYLNNEELTKEKFIQNPINPTEERLYKTGDLGRWLADGNIEFLGRKDNQVKIRGYRIELGEIESAIQNIDTIGQIVVLAKEDKNGTKRLVAYVVASETFDKEQVVQKLKETLPEYMVPQFWVELQSLPLTANGKLDKNALPEPDLNEGLSGDADKQLTEFESRMLAIWEDLLDLDKLGINDNFFDIGGDSLLAIRLTSALRKELNLEVEIRLIFDFPTVATLCEEIGKELEHKDTTTFEIIERPNSIPVSFSQERLWFIDQLEGSIHYHNPAIIRLHGDLDLKALETALRNCIERHEVLRTVFKEVDGKIEQCIQSAEKWHLNVDESRDIIKNAEDFKSIARQLINKPFNLSSDYMLRANLLRTAKNEFTLVVTIHHIAADAWSLSILVKELIEFYGANVEHRKANLKPLPMQYADYSVWQRSTLKGENLDRKIDFWRNKLSGFSTLNLPTDFDRPSVQSIRGARLTFEIDRNLTEKLIALSKQEGSTLFMTLQAVFSILLSRYSGQKDICIGTPIANRSQQELESLIGFFVNTIVLRNDLSGNLMFTDFLKQVKLNTLEAFSNQEVPFEKVVETVVNERDLNRNPIYQILLTLQNTPEVPELRYKNILLTVEETEHDTSQLDLICNFTETEQGLLGSVEYCTDLFKAETIERMMNHFVQLVESVLINPDKVISELTMLSPKESKELLENFNQSESIQVDANSFLELFEKQVDITPNSLALVFEEETLNYFEINKRSNQVAHYLLEKGVTSENLIPICLNPGIEMLVGMLGILKAGAAYVPIDPAFPHDRINYILNDCDANYILISQNNEFEHSRKNLVEINLLKNASEIANQPVSNPKTIIEPNQIAYIIYTSGSTGKPKGVIVEHRNLLNYLVNSKTNYLSNSNHTGTFSHLSFTFDASITALFLPLVNGKSIVMSSKQGLDAFEDVNLLKYAPYDFIKLTPSHLGLLKLKFAYFSGNNLTSRLVVGGEALQKQQLEQWFQDGINIEIINEYGPTEATVGCTVYKLRTDSSLNSISEISIGKPIDQTQIYILGENNELLPKGAIGQISIGGKGVARGYLNQPELSKAKFIANPFVRNKSKLYLTGDLGRWLPDGNLEFKSRKDDQVKIHGYRIELGEIESLLNSLQGIKEVVVIAKEDSQGNKRLVGYLVAGQGFEKQEILKKLESELPEYMVPKLWVELEKLPITTHGKIDRKALPDPEIGEATVKGYVEPVTETEKTLAKIWEDVLELEKVGLNDNFFDLGGDSIIIIQIVSRARRAGIEFEVSDIFTKQTIAALTESINRKNKSVEILSELKPLTGKVGLLPIQTWFFESKHQYPSHFNQSVLINVSKKISFEELSNAINYLINYHDALRFRFAMENGAWKQFYGEQSVELIAEDLTTTTQGELGKTIEHLAENYQTSLDIESGKLVKAVLLTTPSEENDNRLLLIVHHLAVDGVSWRIMLDDLELLVSQIKKGEEPRLISKSLAYSDWYQILENLANSSEINRQKQYWQKAVSQKQNLPYDNQYIGSLKLKDMANCSATLDSEQTKNLLQVVPKTYHTEINDILLSALAKTLQNWTGNTNNVIGLEGHGRETVQKGVNTSRTVGWFTTQYPLILSLNADESIGNLIKNVKEQIRKVPERGIGYGLLKYLNHDSDFEGDEPWDLAFNYFGQLDKVLNNSVWFSEATESAGSGINPENNIHEKISVNAAVKSGELQISWTFSSKHFNPETIERLSLNYLLNLNEMVNHCVEQGSSEFTPSDFGLGETISNTEFDAFLEETITGNLKRRQATEGVYGLSGLQQGMLFHSLYDEQAGSHIVQFSCDFINLNEDYFEKSWNQVIAQHTILRSAFYYDRFSVPVQNVLKSVKLSILKKDLSNLTKNEQNEALEHFIQNDLSKGFDFSEAPLMRIALFNLGDHRTKMIWTSHHILFDGWSMPILISEFLNNYESLYKNTKRISPAVDAYQDYISYLNSLNKANQQTYWQNYLSGIENATLLPFIEASNNRNKGLGKFDTVSLFYDELTTANIQKFVQQKRVTVNTLMQGVWAIILHQYVGSDDIVYGAIVSGRPDDLPNVEQRVGMYINTLPLRARVEPDQSISEWLVNLQNEQVASREFQFMPLHEVIALTEVRGDLFDSILVFENYPVNKVISSTKWSLEVENIEVKEQTNYPLTITIGGSSDLNIRFRYNSNLIKGEYIEAIQKQFNLVVEQIISETVTKILDIDILPVDEEQKILVNFNTSSVNYPLDKSVVEVFEAQVLKTPQATAVVFENESITFEKLNERANQLASYLTKNGVEVETLVPMCFNRSSEMIVAILGILKAGAAYVPIDPAYPADRVRFMLDDCKANLIITQSNLENFVKPGKGQALQILKLDSDWDLINQEPKANPTIKASSQNLAYVIYTSGSTGRPKGVMIEHRALLDHCFGLIQSADLKSCRSYALFSPLVFDAGHAILFTSLISGAVLHVLSEEQLLNGEQLANYIDKNAVDCIKIIPSLWLTYADDGNAVLAKKVMIFGGESFSQRILNSLSSINYKGEVFNHYGPTEATIGKTIHKINLSKSYISVPIGKPFSNSKAYIVDSFMRPVPIGVQGELLLAGDGLARGYLNMKELTEASFVNNPFEKGGKVYKTGDLTRWLPDGEIEYLGRIDEQVKIRGFRIETGEIEAEIVKSNLISQVIVTAKKDKKGVDYLVAYVVATENYTKEAVITHLRSSLPEYMLPTFWVELPAFPRTASGKINRKALPEPNFGENFLNEYVAPVSNVEIALCKIWEELLQVETIGIRDNFFERGGHSLLVIRLLAMVKREFKIELKISAFFELPTVEELAKFIEISQNVAPLEMENYDSIKL